ncbi:hypothetical protein W97_00441 [Coniosporium apollinis CBS 100218]|uniref:BTB domain-containing protein n=1 Tax=Coniosporium apollinis (strain CBS 100218) TaxID=1168221 RepID=R7YH62_CONA1|nr:uncharacterized protein W97_00441 [Coniosporium apollinis CBS 100218]EON61228.1 hypothetical protein W97_00441 [Coniosporium apollinis CBS 100218]
MAAGIGQVVKKRKLDEHLSEASVDDAKDETFQCYIDQFNEGVNPYMITFNKALACRISPFFEEAFRNGSDEATKGVFKFDGTDPEVFRDVSSYIKRGQIFENNRRGKMGSWDHLCDLWILAEKLQLPRVQNLVMEALASKANHTKMDNFTRSHALSRTY